MSLAHCAILTSRTDLSNACIDNDLISKYLHVNHEQKIIIYHHSTVFHFKKYIQMMIFIGKSIFSKIQNGFGRKCHKFNLAPFFETIFVLSHRVPSLNSIRTISIFPYYQWSKIRKFVQFIYVVTTKKMDQF